MSVEAEIARLVKAKNNLKSYVTEKGVVVPEGALLGEIVDLLDEIPESEPTLQEKTVEPATAQQEVAPDEGIDGLSKVTVGAVTSAIDANIQAGNIKKGVSILNVAGTLEEGSGGGGETVSVPAKAVNFRDYEGTILYSYTLEEIQALPELPSLPTHDGLICHGWNWTLADIQALGRACEVGAMYITDDGATRFYISLVDDVDLLGRVRFAASVDGGVTIDWGDGTTEVSSGTSNKAYSHEYAATGDYVISILCTSGKVTFTGANNSYNVVGGFSSTNRRNSNKLKKVHIGQGVTSIGTYAFQYCSSLTSITIPSGVKSVGTYAFQCCYSLASITIPSGVTSIGTYAFHSCYSLASITIPSGVTSIGIYAFRYCYSLASITIPSGVTSIETYAFHSCSSLTSITIPSGVTSIGTYAFHSCGGMLEYHFKSATPPKLGATNVFTSINSACKIYVPTASLSEYQTATYWSSYADYMVGEGTDGIVDAP